MKTTNGTVHFFIGATFAPASNKPLEGTINVDWSILNYNDTDAAGPDDGSFGGPAKIFRAVLLLGRPHTAGDHPPRHLEAGLPGHRHPAAPPAP